MNKKILAFLLTSIAPVISFALAFLVLGVVAVPWYIMRVKVENSYTPFIGITVYLFAIAFLCWIFVYLTDNQNILKIISGSLILNTIVICLSGYLSNASNTDWEVFIQVYCYYYFFYCSGIYIVHLMVNRERRCDINDAN